MALQLSYNFVLFTRLVGSCPPTSDHATLQLRSITLRDDCHCYIAIDVVL